MSRKKFQIISAASLCKLLTYNQENLQSPNFLLAITNHVTAFSHQKTELLQTRPLQSFSAQHFSMHIFL